MSKRNGEIFERIFAELQSHGEILRRQGEVLQQHTTMLREHNEILGELLKEMRDVKYELKEINRRFTENVPAWGDEIVIELPDGHAITGRLKRKK
jgi:hypothetical protein